MSVALKNALLGQSITALSTEEAVVINANQNVNFDGSVIAQAGDYSTLRVNNTNVSVAGHQHAISDVANLQSTLNSLTGQAPSTTAASNNLFLWSNFR